MQYVGFCLAGANVVIRVVKNKMENHLRNPRINTSNVINIGIYAGRLCFLK